MLFAFFFVQNIENFLSRCTIFDLYTVGQMRICVFVAAFAGSNNAVKSCVTDTASCESGIFCVPARGLAGQRHACKFADHACGSWLPWNAEGKGRRWLQIASITLAVAPLRSPAPRHSRAPRCERRPAIVHEMIMVVRYEVAGSRKAVRHLDWPVGSYKRREARADGRRDYAPRRRDAEPRCAPASTPAGCCVSFTGTL